MKNPFSENIRLPLSWLFAVVMLFTTALEKAMAEPIYLGIDVLEAADFKPLRGNKVGLLTHPAGVNRQGKSTIEVLRKAPEVDLVALYGPEHGIYGDEKANIPIEDKIDPRTGLPVYSLYGKYRKPTDEMLKNLDVMVVDLQDLGVRSYTYVSAMRYTMEACFENDVAVMVLDRPNPIGGLKVAGPPLEKKWMSYVGAYSVPYVHGLTIAELARMAKKEKGWLDIPEQTRKQGRLIIVPMHGWKRSMLWADTGLQWIPTSPAIPDLSSAMGYAMTGLGAQLGGFSHGYGTRWSFRLLTHRKKDAQTVYRALKRKNIPGIRLKPIRYRNSGGQKKEGVYVMVENWNQLHPTEISFHMMQLAAKWSDKNPFRTAKSSRQNLFNKHVGSTPWWKALVDKGSQVNVDRFIKKWQKQAKRFQQYSNRYYLYE